MTRLAAFGPLSRAGSGRQCGGVIWNTDYNLQAIYYTQSLILY